MSKIAIVTDSNSGITKEMAAKLNVHVIPMPFFINEELYFEEITLSQEQFYNALEGKAEISTSMPSLADVTDLWDKLLETYDEIVHIPMSSGLSGSTNAATVMSRDYDGKVQVVDNRRISVTQLHSIMDARMLADAGWSAEKIKNYLEETAGDSSIYITIPTLTYLKKGGRITPAAAALGTLLRLKTCFADSGCKAGCLCKEPYHEGCPRNHVGGN